MTMRLVIITPTAIVADDRDVTYVRAEDVTGAFGIQPGHADFLTALAISVIIWRTGGGRERYAAVDGGALTVRGGASVEVATRQAVINDDLRHLREEILGQMRQSARAEHEARASARKLERAMIRELYRYLRPSDRPFTPRAIRDEGWKS